jgi:hypothetical protein
MKKIQTGLLLLLFTVLLLASCKKNTDVIASQAGGTSKESGILIQSLTGEVTDATSSSFCSAKTVPICAGQFTNIGTVSVQTAINGRTYITYSLKSYWFFQELHLYIGTQDRIPVSGGGNANPGQFPFSKVFTAPYTCNKYTFVFDSLPEFYVVAAHSAVVKIVNGVQVDAQTGWGDGCSGKTINSADGGSWGTYFTYSGAMCTLSSVQNSMADICAYPVTTYFGLHPIYNTVQPWKDTAVIVGAYTYSEAEGRAIAAAPDPAGSINDAKFAFTRLATLKLSHTDYSNNIALAFAANIIETWLAGQNKLSPNNLPNGNYAARNAAMIINSWINSHICPER